MSHIKGLNRREFLTSATGSLLGAGFAIKGSGQQSSATVYEFVNGQWFDGQDFRASRFYSVKRMLSTREPGKIDSVIDLSGKYVIPPFGEAHNHNVEWSGEERFAAVKRSYLEAGIFYVKNPNNLPRSRTPLLDKINNPSSIDVVFSNGGLTASGGHPVDIVKRGIERGGMTAADGDGAFYFIIDDLGDLDRKWPAIVAGKPDFIKTYLMYSEEYEKRKSDDKYLSWRGLNPTLLPEIVRRAHRAGLRVATHVETATDFHNALIAGVDEMAHTPGFRPEFGDWTKYDASRFKISDADARLAGRKRVSVATTLVSAVEQAFLKKGGVPTNEIRDLLTDNLQLLKKYNVPIAIGSDSYRQTSLPEALNLHKLGVFDNRELLKLWCETTPESIFPTRRLGRLRNAYEASFLVLDGNPLVDFSNVQRINRRFKQGEFLSV